MQVPRQGAVPPAPRRRRRVKKTVNNNTKNVLEQPVSLNETVLGIPKNVLDSLPIEPEAKPMPVMTVSRSVTNFESDVEEFVDVMHIMTDPRLVIKRIRLLCASEGMAGLRLINMETDEELLTETVDNEELTVVELTNLPETLIDTAIIQANPEGVRLQILQVEIWSEVLPKTDK